jgi:hypothetical protein
MWPWVAKSAPSPRNRLKAFPPQLPPHLLPRPLRQHRRKQGVQLARVHRRGVLLDALRVREHERAPQRGVAGAELVVDYAVQPVVQEHKLVAAAWALAHELQREGGGSAGVGGGQQRARHQLKERPG